MVFYFDDYYVDTLEKTWNQFSEAIFEWSALLGECGWTPVMRPH